MEPNVNDLIFVSSNLELATLAFGWHMYDQLWQLMLDTGLAFLPFLGMLINNFVQPITATYTTSAAQLSLKKVEWDLIQMLIIIVLAGQPFLELKMDKYRRLDLCQSDGKGGFKPYEQAKIDSTGDGHKPRPLSGPLESPRVPLWWFAVQSFSTGFTEAAKAAVPCVQDARGMLSDMISGTMAENTSLTREIEDFIEKCYIPTKSFIKLDTESGSKSDSAFNRTKYNEFKGKYSGGLYDDTEFLGSRTFRAMGANNIHGNPNFYGREIKIRGWDGNPLITDNVTCRDWWGEDAGAKLYDLGLYAAKLRLAPSPKDVPPIPITFEALRQLRFRIYLLATIDSSMFNLLIGKNKHLPEYITQPMVLQHSKDVFKFEWNSSYSNLSDVSDFEKLMIASEGSREFQIDKTIKQYVSTNIIENLENLPQTKEPGFWKRGAAGIGLLMASLGTYATAYIARESFPHIQALLLMAMCMFMGMGLVFSGYTLQFLYAGSLGIFTLKFMGFILYFCHWIDNNLIVFLSGQKGMSGEGAWTNLSEVVNAVYTDRGFSRLILDYSIAGIYFSFPSLFATVMVWAGVRGAEVIGEAQKAANPLEQAAQHGAQQVQKIVTQLASAVGELIPGVGHAIRFMKGKH